MVVNMGVKYCTSLEKGQNDGRFIVISNAVEAKHHYPMQLNLQFISEDD